MPRVWAVIRVIRQINFWENARRFVDGQPQAPRHRKRMQIIPDK